MASNNGKRLKEEDMFVRYDLHFPVDESSRLSNERTGGRRYVFALDCFLTARVLIGKYISPVQGPPESARMRGLTARM